MSILLKLIYELRSILFFQIILIIINSIIYLSWTSKNYIIYDIYINKDIDSKLYNNLNNNYEKQLTLLKTKILIYNFNKIISNSKDNIIKIYTGQCIAVLNT